MSTVRSAYLAIMFMTQTMIVTNLTEIISSDVK